MSQTIRSTVILSAALASSLVVGCGSEAAEPSPADDTARVEAGTAQGLLAQLPEDVRRLVEASLAARAEGAPAGAWPMAPHAVGDLDALFVPQAFGAQPGPAADMQAWGEALAALAMLGYAGQDLGGWDTGAGWDLGALGYGAGSPADPWLAGGQIDGNWLTGTAISTSGDSGYIALGDGGFVSW